MTIEYAHDIELTVEMDDGIPVVLIDIDGALFDFTADDAQIFVDMVIRAIETARDHDHDDGDGD